MVCAQIEQLLLIEASFISNLLKASLGPRQALQDIVTLSQVSKCLLSVLYSLNYLKKRLKLKQNWLKIGHFGFFGACTFLFCASLVLFRLFGCAGEASFAAAGRLRRELRASCPRQERMELTNSKLEIILWYIFSIFQHGRKTAKNYSSVH